jgi:hypothetical protein
VIATSALVKQLTQLVSTRLLDPLEILTEGADAVQALREICAVRVKTWATLLLGDDDQAAVATAARLIATLYPSDTAFDPPAQWWQTPLGQVVARRVGHPSTDAVSYSVAGAMLGITRQGVHDLVNRGKLARHPDGGVLVASVRARLA